MAEVWLLLMLWTGCCSGTGGVAAPTSVPFSSEVACRAAGERIAGWPEIQRQYQPVRLLRWECVRNG